MEAIDHDVELTTHHTPLLDPPSLARDSGGWRPLRGTLMLFGSIVFILSLGGLIIKQRHEPSESEPKSIIALLGRGIGEGVSAKSNPSLNSYNVSYDWTNAMLSWQRTAFHFQPQNNWMNDPNGPLFHKGWYHLFYQYNPDSAVWGNISWGHAVSTDLIHWLYLPIALLPDTWYDLNGVWSGSATLLPDGRIIMLYTGDTNQFVQVQNIAYPTNLSDPLLLHWAKDPHNPLLLPPPGIGPKNFRDPTTAWIGPDQKWRILLGSKVNKTGLSLVYKTKDFIHYELNDNYLHAVPGTGMWECVDFYPVSTNGFEGLDTSVNGPLVKHVLKASLDDTKMDHYAIGRYFVENDTWVPDNPNEDVGIGLRLDYGGIYYASKTFYDQYKKRRVLWGWIKETDSESADLKKGWASLQTIPRTVVFDNKTGTNLLQWPVEEVESLRLSSVEFEGVLLKPGSIVPLDIGSATQLDIFGEFEIELLASEGIGEDNNVGCGGGAVDRRPLGPFGIVVIADDQLSELTPIYLTLSNTTNGTSTTYFCVDETRSSKAPDVSKQVYESKVPVFSDEKLSTRVLVDHSIIESFAQGGRSVITSRVYPTEEVIYGAARLFLFNNATHINIKASLKIWQLNSAFIHPFPQHIQ
ncbi:PREDICTED: beta-fructofuranosidase, soluble isoenzyme I-like isoform X1 [Lupinus angustifolius]|uniref:beta-fructofuranosidase, soluble isoenzyme I-like isoform X1 n=2 Tax=Lupinus angustifolius TaxID=3871 RepID=UPI00092F858B|nr:PREDICTED: beta-fructofuranosidase, soluble isoenzyme I-like isoform X1 [Lupinus angustifolius]